MIERRRGAILNVSSSASFLPIPRMAAYAATKAYVTSLSEALAHRGARPFGITVTALCPGSGAHGVRRQSRCARSDPKRKAPAFTYVPVEEVVRVWRSKAVERNRPHS